MNLSTMSCIHFRFGFVSVHQMSIFSSDVPFPRMNYIYKPFVKITINAGMDGHAVLAVSENVN